MAIDNPMYIDQKALHRPSAIRLLSYGLTTGTQGVIGNTDLQVRALGTPGNQVQVMPGAFNVLARHLGGAYESYAGKIRVAETSQPISPTTSSGGRSDLVILRVENPYVSGSGAWEEPADPVEGPYAFVRVIEGVPNTTYDVRQLTSIGGDTWSAITLARIDRPASTGVVTSAAGVIRDLRSLASLGGTRTVIVENPAVEPPPIASSYFLQFKDQPRDATYPSSEITHNYWSANQQWQSWPNRATWQVPVPSWAVSMDIDAAIFNAQILDGDVFAQLSFEIAGSRGYVSPNVIAIDYVQVPGRHTLPFGGTYPVPAAIRGKVVTFRMQMASYHPAPGRMDAKTGTTAKLAVNFQRVPDAS